MIDIIQGDITNPIWPDSNRVIIHCCNDDNLMGAGVALALSMKWPKVKTDYHNWALNRPHEFKLGQVQFVSVEPSIEVVNLIGQRSVGYQEFQNLGKRLPPVRYESLYEGFLRIRNEVKGRFKPGERWTEYTFHLPLIGSGLAGGDLYQVFKQYIKAFDGTNSRTCFYAYSDVDYELLKEVYTYYYPQVVHKT